MKAIIAMSGGVDSSVAAYLLKKQGYEVVGLSFELWDKRDLSNSDVCCSIETIRLAKSVAEHIGIKHYSVDVRDTFYTKVVEEFCESYISGITPNPCILCNKHIKFDFLLKQAEEMGADFIATGHYAQIVGRRTSDDEQRITSAARRSTLDERRYLLKKGVDPVKDQSYVLYVMKQDELAKTVFPLGEMNKDQARSIARERGLATAMRAESQEICFVGNEKYAEFMKAFAPEALQPGPIVDTAGNVLGRHEGIAFYTIGQRRGLGISSPVPRYVADIDRKNSTIVIGSREDAMKSRCNVKEMNWIAIPSLTRPVKAGVKIRSTTGEMPATISPDDNGHVLVEFDEPQWAPAPGQSAVFYEDDIVLGGGVIV